MQTTKELSFSDKNEVIKADDFSQKADARNAEDLQNNTDNQKESEVLVVQNTHLKEGDTNKKAPPKVKSRSIFIKSKKNTSQKKDQEQVVNEKINLNDESEDEIINSDFQSSESLNQKQNKKNKFKIRAPKFLKIKKRTHKKDSELSNSQEDISQNLHQPKQAEVSLSFLYPNLSKLEVDDSPPPYSVDTPKGHTNCVPSAPPLVQISSALNECRPQQHTDEKDFQNYILKHGNALGDMRKNQSYKTMSLQNNNSTRYAASKPVDSMHLPGIGLIFARFDAKNTNIKSALAQRKTSPNLLQIANTGSTIVKHDTINTPFDKKFNHMRNPSLAKSSSAVLETLEGKKSRLRFNTYGKSLLIFVFAFAIAEVMQRAGRRHTNALYCLAFLASLFYVFGYSIHTSSLRRSVNENKEHDGISSTASALLMPVVLGAMLAPIYFRFNYKEVLAAMTATLCIFGVSAVYGKATDKNLAQYQHTFAVAAISLIAVSLVNVLIFKSSIAEVGISAAFIAFHAFCICSSAQRIDKQAENVSTKNEAQFENLEAMDIANSLVGVTVEFLNIKKEIAK